MTDDQNNEQRIVSSTRDVAAAPDTIFALIADPAEQPRWDGNDNLGTAAPGQRIHAVGDVFVTTLTKGVDRDNHVVEFEEGRRVAWLPAEAGKPTIGQLWRWELEPLEPGRTRVTHTYDWTNLTDEQRLPRARATTEDKLRASVDRLAELAECDT
ncbi:SRPBCC family protein [Spelaeicoccus albus]|uniref:Uncharacterized protein YndB with AHSA1/START domain n=1 Tax=Spelaeicoccus albus TaxID=1280376 RepID=A0A7Z0A939_9MICO|nr:SRPBCC family protein [Spelaeicoccus albus]NYI66659.1 uncharacterized protein YndB with AHSA1/START domain [Spelaeicoccus albus]